MENTKRNIPTVFVSSTCYDLKQVRVDIKDFFESTYGFNAILSEFNSFPIDPSIGTCDNCLNNVDNYADLFILIIGTCYGYITDTGKSITNLEYLHAKAKGVPVFVFVDKQLYSTWTVWKNNKEADFSKLVDNPRIFDFISELYKERWVYTYENVRDITTTMKNQLSLIFSDGLIFRKNISNPKYNILNAGLSPSAIRIVVEQPFMWEYKFLAYVVRDEFDKLKKNRWDFKYGFFDGHTFSREPIALLDDISDKIHELDKISNLLDILINHTLQEAMGAPGIPSDLEMIVYVARQLSMLYRKMIEWGLYFKSLHVDSDFDTLLQLLYQLPTTALNQIDIFVDDLYDKFTSLPDTEVTIDKTINLHCSLDVGNTADIITEMQRITPIVKEKLLMNSEN